MSGSKVTLREVIEKYLAAGGGYGHEVAISALGFSRDEVEDVFSAFDEDYHIGRFFHFRLGDGESYTVDGFPQTHVSIDDAVQSIL
ncbi:MAG TPA: hypothetical protein VJR26_16040 [Candidatus Acidoferrales bacterium]|nr:hypothetical protein [Candidatus Acidoferrales bacterium]